MNKFRENHLVRIIKPHLRLYCSLLVGIGISFLGPFAGLHSQLTSSIFGYDLGVIVYLFLAIHLIFQGDLESMRRRAQVQDDGKKVVLFLVVMALLFSLSAIFAELTLVKNLQGSEKYARLILTFATIILSWFFTNTVFALHYAHDYYFDLQQKRGGGLVFLPENEEPRYVDFFYFSFIIGATAQTADVTLASQKMRRTCLLHSILSFFFNTILLALTINMASGLV